uniref:Uncharacterized protein n=1 Tax=Meloidogyne incognita TaxID=6306 RepID=A0A914NGT0_MELIC
MASSDDEEGDEGRNQRGEQALKLVLLGDSGVGKTSICSRLAQHTFPQKYIQTSGVDFYSRRVQLRQQNSVLLQLWDVGGHNLASPSMLNTYIFGAHVKFLNYFNFTNFFKKGVLFVYDVTNSQSFENINDWLSAAKKLDKQMEKPFYMALIGNKADSEHRRSVRPERHSKFADQNGMQSHFYLSAKNDDSIELIFRKIATEILGTKITRNEPEQSSAKPQASTTTTTNVEENINKKSEKDVENDDKTASKESKTTKETSSKDTANQRSSSTCLLQ